MLSRAWRWACPYRQEKSMTITWCSCVNLRSMWRRDIDTRFMQWTYSRMQTFLEGGRVRVMEGFVRGPCRRLIILIILLILLMYSCLTLGNLFTDLHMSFEVRLLNRPVTATTPTETRWIRIHQWSLNGSQKSVFSPFLPTIFRRLSSLFVFNEMGLCLIISVEFLATCRTFDTFSYLVVMLKLYRSR